MEKYNSGAKWESIVGYSRAVKAGDMIYISGTVAVDENGNFHSRGDAYEQTKYILEKIEKVLEHFGANLKNVVRTRIFVSNIIYWDRIGKAHGEFFKDIKPATSMVEVSNLIDAECLVEIEADAYIG